MRQSGDSSTIDVAGEHIVLRRDAMELHLLPDKAIWWPARATLFVADVHLGKAAAYRRLGQPVPEGPSADSLARLTRLIDRHGPDRLVVLGDFIHDALVFTPLLVEQLQRWRQRHGGLHLTVVRGNHDASLEQWPPSLRIEDADEPCLLDRQYQWFAWHTPPGAAARKDSQRASQRASQTTLLSTFHLAGHWHPATLLRDRHRDRLRLPCFVLDEDRLVLPAFGDFTGGDTRIVPPMARRFPVGGGRVWALPDATAPPCRTRTTTPPTD